MSLFAATRSEITKQFSTAIWWVLALILVVFVGLVSVGIAIAIGGSATGLFGGPESTLPENSTALIYSLGAALGYLFALLVGTLSVTNEFRYKTLTPTFLATPRRGTALGAKALSGIFLGVVYGALSTLVCVGGGAIVFASFGLDTGLGATESWALIGRSLLAFVLWTLIGVGVGTLLRNQVAAVVSVLAFTLFLEPLLHLAGALIEGLSAITAYLPRAAADVLVGNSLFSLGATPGEGMQWWTGAVILGVYAVALLLLGYLASWRRDVS